MIFHSQNYEFILNLENTCDSFLLHVDFKTSICKCKLFISNAHEKFCIPNHVGEKTHSGSVIFDRQSFPIMQSGVIAAGVSHRRRVFSRGHLQGSEVTDGEEACEIPSRIRS